MLEQNWSTDVLWKKETKWLAGNIDDKIKIIFLRKFDSYGWEQLVIIIIADENGSFCQNLLGRHMVYNFCVS